MRDSLVSHFQHIYSWYDLSFFQLFRHIQRYCDLKTAVVIFNLIPVKFVFEIQNVN